MQGNQDDYRFRPRESLHPELDTLNDIVIRQAEQTLRHRDLLVRAILVLYTLTLSAMLALFYLSGLGILLFSDNVLISLSGVVVGELGVGAMLMVIMKNIFPSA